MWVIYVHTSLLTAGRKERKALSMEQLAVIDFLVLARAKVSGLQSLQRRGMQQHACTLCVRAIRAVPCVSSGCSRHGRLLQKGQTLPLPPLTPSCCKG